MGLNHPGQPVDRRSASVRNNTPSYNGEYFKYEFPGNTASGSDEIDLKYLLKVLLRYKYIAIGIVLLTTISAAIYAYSLPSVYQSTGTILIQEERNRYTWAGSDLNSILSSSFGVGAGSRLVNEVEILQSRMVASEIADKVFETETLENGKLFPILWYDYPEDSTRASREMVVRRIQNRMNVNRADLDSDILRIAYTSPSPFEAAALVNITIDTYTEISARQKRTAATAALGFLEEEKRQAEEELADSEERLRSYMSQTNLVQVDSQTDAAINRLAELESQKQTVQVQRVSVSSSIEAYERQLEQIRPGLAEQFAENISGQLSRAQFRLAELRTERDLLTQRNPALNENPELEPQYASLLSEIETVRNQIQQITSDLLSADDSDVYIGFLDSEDGGVTNRIIELRRNLIELRITESQLDAQEDVLNSRIQEENQFLDNLPDNMIELARLRRDAQVNEQLYSVISEQFTQTQLWEQTQYGSGRSIDMGEVPQFPTGPNRKLYILIGFLLGGVISVGFVTAKESFNKKIDGTTKLRGLGLAVLGTIPDKMPYIKKRFKGKEFVKVDDKMVSSTWSILIDAISPVSESYRRLHNNIIYADPDQKIQTIAITSPKKSEGKSTVSINLAVALAEAGKSVLLLDLDFRRPNLHRLTGEERERGMIEYFYDDMTLEEVIKSTAAPGVDLITSGRRIQNPSAVVQSEKMKNLLEILKTRYDHIVMDTAPYGVVTDGAVMMKRADGIVLISKFNDTRLNEMIHTLENLNHIQGRILGAVITNYHHRSSSDYYYSDYTYDSYEAYEEYHE
ncbi:MAG TPA: polysaccharide biosynthesis tyrosine autokinase [Balneolaceae bacterium]|nr:polysaccharide biosynthesis tyrosine autokinase [Balneolaceae bacterium]